MEIKANKKYNYCLDFIKGIACICVVFMHCEFPGTLGIAVQAVSRWVIPFFFMVSGYYSFKEDNKYNTIIAIKKIKHILNITLVSTLFYLVLALVANRFIVDYSFKRLFDFLVLNNPSYIAEQLWFLYALLYVYIIYYFVIQKFNLFKIAYISAFILIVAYVFLAQGLHVIGIKGINSFYYRNWIFVGFPWFMIGSLIHKKQKQINIKNYLIIIAVVLFTVLNLVERYFVFGRDFGVNITSIPQVILLFLYGINNPNKFNGIIQKLGKNLSLFIYILHPFIWHGYEYIYRYLKIDNNAIMNYLMPIVVLGTTIIGSLIVYFVKIKVFSKSKGNQNK